MIPLRLLGLGCCLWLTGCGDGVLLQDAAGKFRLLAQCSQANFGAALERHDDIRVVLVLDRAGKEVAATIREAAVEKPLVVGISDSPVPEAELPDALVVTQSGAAAAVELGLLACNGIDIPKTPIPVGARIVTAANLANGGDAQTAPGDVILELLRQQHAATLTTTPATDEIHEIGLIQLADEAWQTAAAEAADQAARRFPQVHFNRVMLRGDAGLEALATQLIQKGCRALLVTTSDHDAVSTVMRIAAGAADGPAAVIVLDPLVADHGTCCVGCSPAATGMAAAEAVRRLAPAGASIVTVAADQHTPQTRQRSEGFVHALGLKKP